MFVFLIALGPYSAWIVRIPNSSWIVRLSAWIVRLDLEDALSRWCFSRQSKKRLSVAFSRVEAHFVASAIRHTTGPVGIFLFPNYCNSIHYLFLFSFETFDTSSFYVFLKFLFMPCYLFLSFDGSACEHYCSLSCEYNGRKDKNRNERSMEVRMKLFKGHLFVFTPK